ncbi:MAG: hypothetical protein L3J34_09775 [Flavobacteriaceae bacterium]|nr:hypothetical protein [Flavobacteriaceae bacterium]
MKKMIYYFIITLGIISCNSEDENLLLQGEFEFITEYSTTVTVGGFVGITERIFERGEVYKGTDEGKETITIRIAEHTELNNDCPNSWCYQEFLEVPRKFLKLVE